MLNRRFRHAGIAALKHLLASLLVAVLCAWLVFGVWYPYPYGELAGGRGLFLLMISVDITCGPLLTFVVFNPNKKRAELWRDIGVIVVLQLSALAYGLNSTLQARPIHLAYEGDRFRVVSLPDIVQTEMDQAPENFKRFSYFGPTLIGVKLLKSSDPGYLESLELALKGIHPAYRPSRWIAYSAQHQDILSVLKPLSKLREINKTRGVELDAWLTQSEFSEKDLGYLPLVSEGKNDWVVIVQRGNLSPVTYLHLDGWDK